MINIYYSPKHDSNVHIDFSGSKSFWDILNVCKMNALDYNPKLKHHLIHPKKYIDIDFHNVLSPLDSIEYVDCNLDSIKEGSVIKLETKKVRRSIKDELMPVAPLKGKKGYENYQYEALKEGVQWNRRYFALAPGLGKGWILTNQINQLFGQGYIDKALIIAKAEGAITTKHKILEFSNLFSEEDILVVNTSKDRRYPFTDPNHKDKKVVIATYSTMRAIVEEEAKRQKKTFSNRTKKYLFDLDKLEWGTNRGLFLDESQEVGNFSSKQTKALYIHRSFFQFRYAYSGSPADESPSKWYSQLRLLDENLIPMSFQDWQKTIYKMGRFINGKFNPFIAGDLIPSKYETFKQTILNKYVNFKSKDVLELPEKRIEDIYVELTDKHKDIVNMTVKNTLIRIKRDNGGILQKDDFRKNIPVIKTALDNPQSLYSEEKIKKYEYDEAFIKKLKSWKLEDHSKIDVVDSLIEKHIGQKQKVILFSWHPDNIDDLAEHYKKHKPLKIHGGVKPRKGQSKDELKFEISDIFQKDEKVKLLVASSLSLKTSLDLNEAEVIIYFDYTGKYTDFDQSLSRVFRNGLKKPIIIYRIIIENSLNERDIKLIDHKAEEKDSLFNIKDSFSQEDYENILLGKVI